MICWSGFFLVVCFFFLLLRIEIDKGRKGSYIRLLRAAGAALHVLVRREELESLEDVRIRCTKDRVLLAWWILQMTILLLFFMCFFLIRRNTYKDGLDRSYVFMITCA
jgi:hypothetical protein